MNLWMDTHCGMAGQAAPKLLPAEQEHKVANPEALLLQIIG